MMSLDFYAARLAPQQRIAKKQAMLTYIFYGTAALLLGFFTSSMVVPFSVACIFHWIFFKPLFGITALDVAGTVWVTTDVVYDLYAPSIFLFFSVAGWLMALAFRVSSTFAKLGVAQRPPIIPVPVPMSVSEEKSTYYMTIDTPMHNISGGLIKRILIASVLIICLVAVTLIYELVRTLPVVMLIVQAVVDLVVLFIGLVVITWGFNTQKTIYLSWSVGSSVRTATLTRAILIVLGLLLSLVMLLVAVVLSALFVWNPFYGALCAGAAVCLIFGTAHLIINLIIPCVCTLRSRQGKRPSALCSYVPAPPMN